MKIFVKNDFYIFAPSDLDLWSLNLKFAPLVTLVQRYVSAKLEIFKAFLFRENRSQGPRDGRTDEHTDGRSATLNAAQGPLWRAA